MARIDWSPVIDWAARWVRAQSLPVTLRQAFYALVSVQMIPNTESAYKTLSAKTAEGRRDGWFPEFVDETRTIHTPSAFEDEDHLFRAALHSWRLDRTLGQDYQVWLVHEKRGGVAALRQTFAPFGAPVLGLGGYVSQTIADEVRRRIDRDGRPAVCLYAGDFDPSGEDIRRDFEERVAAFAEFVHVALTDEQVDAYGLPENPGKTTDSRAAAFARRHGRLVQVEVDALPPAELDRLYREAFERWHDPDAYDAVMAEEGHALEAMTAHLAAYVRPE